MHSPVTRRQVAASLARHGYQHNLSAKPNPHEMPMIMQLGPKPADWIIIYINDQSVRFTVLPFGKIHIASYDVLLNPVTPRTDPDELKQEMLVAEDLVRQSRWAVLTYVSQVDIAPTLTTDNNPPDHRNGAIKP